VETKVYYFFINIITLLNKNSDFYLKIYYIIDYIIVGSDSGRVVILEYNPAKNILEKVN
jgi:hypothetical protein